MPVALGNRTKVSEAQGVVKMVAAEVRRRIWERKTLPPRYLGGYGDGDGS